MGQVQSLETSQRPSKSPTVAEEARLRLLAGLPVRSRRMQLAGISTWVLEGGEGPPLVLLHGPGEHSAKWFRVIPELAKRHRVVIPDLPGHGNSDAIDGPVQPGRVLAWLGQLIERACSSPAVLVGQSLGAAIAARHAAAGGAGLRCVVLADALGLAPLQPAPEFGQALMAFVGEPSRENHDRLWRQCAFDLERLRTGLGPMWDDLGAYNLDRARVARLKPTQQGLMEQFGFPEIPAEELSRIAVPTFLIWGRHDRATPLSVAEAASVRFGWPLHVIENCNDDPPVEQPDALLRALRAALGGG